MDPSSNDLYERTNFVSGIRTAVFVVVVGAIAVVADRSLFNPPHAVTAPTVATPAAAPPAPSDGFALPAHMKPTAADVAPGAATF